ncbi:MAG TPA: DUF167 domain-containing protein [Rhodospirillales bacterium]|nr:DUF167 domain-containing protein [Rhodospirillales bacterium]HIM21281.1 DUF167 domain-containing protein [Rhodospirillales bacterium]|tara:strand:- start:64 stop:417 length:354 start_codon:yes stop_codon:yes gene_type:complete
MVAPSNLFYIVNDKFRVIVRLTPKASQNSIVSLAHETDGSVVIKTSVTATPEAGKANTALLKLLATEWKLPKSSLSIIKGATTRRKIIEIAKDRQIVEPVLTAWIKRRANKNVYLER